MACEMGSRELLVTELVFDNLLTERPPEEIAALLSCNTLSKDPFGDLGYRQSRPSSPTTALGRTALSPLPPLFGHHLSRKRTRCSKNAGTLLLLAFFASVITLIKN